MNGNLPYTPVSIVDFANGGIASVVHDGTLTGNGTSGSPLGVNPSSLADKVEVLTDHVTINGNGTNTANGILSVNFAGPGESRGGCN